MIIRSQQSLGLKSAVFWVLHNCSLTNQNLVVRSTQKLTVHDIKINQGVGWSFDGLGGEFRSREVLAPSKVKVKFQVAREVHLPDIGATSLYTQKAAHRGLSGAAGVIRPLESA